MGKKPKLKNLPVEKKESKISPKNSPDSFMSLNPSWKFCWLAFDGQWGWSKIEEVKTWERIVKQLQNWESMKWIEILNNPRNHQIHRDQLDKNVQKWLDRRNLDDFETYSLHVGGKERIFGILIQGVFYVIWWDPDHKICPAPKKHT